MARKADHVVAAAHAHTNLNTWGAVIAILEGGLLYGGSRDGAAARRVIGIAKAQQQKHLALYDKARAAARKS